MLKKSRPGFTLVELVIVIAILGILALYAIPKFDGLIEEARSAEARSQLGVFRSALSIYYAKNHGHYPDVTADFGSLFAEGKVPEVEITITNGTVVSRGNVLWLTKDNGVIEPGEGEVVENEGTCWAYDVSTDLTKADIRLNSASIDPITGKKWYEY